MVTIVLTSDLHLDAPDGNAPVGSRERLMTFKKIIALAKDYDMLLIAGDLFDSSDPADDLTAEVTKLLQSLRNKGTRILFSPGDRESQRGGISGKVASLPFDKVFATTDSDRSPYYFEKEGQSIYVHGAPAASGIDLTAIEKKPEDGFHIGLFHARFDRAENETVEGLTSIRKDDIRELKLDFYALGHNHDFRLYKYVDKIIGAYPGSPESVTGAETGDRYVLSLTVDGNRLEQIKRLTINTITVLHKVFDCSNTSKDEIVSFIEQTASMKNSLTLTLTGTRRYLLPDIASQYRTRYYRIDIQDGSEVPLELLVQELSAENSLRGTFFAILKERIDKSELPDDLDREELAAVLGRMTRESPALSEEQLCALFNA